MCPNLSCKRARLAWSAATSAPNAIQISETAPEASFRSSRPHSASRSAAPPEGSSVPPMCGLKATPRARAARLSGCGPAASLLSVSTESRAFLAPAPLTTSTAEHPAFPTSAAYSLNRAYVASSREACSPRAFLPEPTYAILADHTHDTSMDGGSASLSTSTSRGFVPADVRPLNVKRTREIPGCPAASSRCASGRITLGTSARSCPNSL
mmetsp:Transcript_4240/g.10768  ORF Transcript_4240/g.10768 Transcript_4240/m.10768 type:complete len:210 (-) Transcript_4240:111-740(-)